MKNDLQKNADRFLGFANTYDNVRPSCPKYVLKCLINYLGYKPQTVVDFGCGTGLSTKFWSKYSNNVIGIEPSKDMINLAIKKSKNYKNIKYINAFSNETGLNDNIADIITCSQSFHWMEPISTLKEVNRLLKPNGIFAVYDCDWPPVFKWEIDFEYEKLFNKVFEIEATHKEFKNSFSRWNKNEHLNNLKNSGHFRFVREIVFTNTEKCTADRYIGIALSQGGLQSIIKNNIELIKPELDSFIEKVKMAFDNKTYNIDFCYRMRIGVK